MVIKREENINKPNKWIEYIKSKSLLKEKLIKVTNSHNINNLKISKIKYRHYYWRYKKML